MPAPPSPADTSVPNLLFSTNPTALSSFACNTCKKRKIKCDRVAPTCCHCQKANRSCEYPLSVPKPGPKAGFAAGRKRRSEFAGLDDGDGGKSERGNRDGNGEGAAKVEGHGRNGDGDSDDGEIGLDDSLAEIMHPKHHRPDAEMSPGSTAIPGMSGYGLRSPLSLNDYSRGFSEGNEPSELSIHSHGGEEGTPTVLAQALASMSITWLDCRAWIEVHFDNLTAFSLFHRPTFFDKKIPSITSAKELDAFLTAIVACAKPLADRSSNGDGRAIGEGTALGSLPAPCVWERARTLVRDCLDAYVEETPPLHLLQALMMPTWHQLCRGVRSRGWRAVGECVRICYEMGLHREDDDSETATAAGQRSWAEREERRRVWWVIWELDIFCSTIRRLPTAIQWGVNKIKLPVPDEDWYAGRETPSCTLAASSPDRWKNLDKAGNTSGAAWFTVLNSYKYEAYLLSTNPQSSALRYSGTSDARASYDAIRKHRDMLINCLHCTQLAMPDNLSVRDRFLGFRPGRRRDDAWRYSCHCILQVTKFMCYRLDIFLRYKLDRAGPSRSNSSAGKMQKTGTTTTTTTDGSSRLAWEQFTASGDEIVRMLRSSAPDHVQWVSPILVNAIWFGAAALVVGRVLGPSVLDKQLMSANFDLLRATIRQYIKISSVPEALLSSLDNLEDNLRALNNKGGVTPATTATDLSTMSFVSLRDSGSPLGASPADTERSKATQTSVPPSILNLVGQEKVASTEQQQMFHPTVLLPGNEGLLDPSADAGLDMTQEFSDLDELWASSEGWGFNLDYFRCPY